MIRTLFQLGIKDRRLLAAARRAIGGEQALVGAARADILASEAAAIVLSTCERFEIYTLTDSRRFASIMRAFGERLEADPRHVLDIRIGAAAAGHLFAVATGIDSRFIGESHILGQVSRAPIVSIAGESTMTRMTLSRLVQAAVACGRSARQRSGLGELSTTCVDACFTHVHTHLAGDRGRRIAVLGSGSLAREIGLRLDRETEAEVTVFARHHESAATHPAGARIVHARLCTLPERLAAFGILIAATSAHEHLLTHAHFLQAFHTRGSGPFLAIDLGMPANIDPDLARMPSVTLHTLDTLALEQQRPVAVIGRARVLVRAAAERWACRWLTHVESASTERLLTAGVG